MRQDKELMYGSFDEKFGKYLILEKEFPFRVVLSKGEGGFKRGIYGEYRSLNGVIIMKMEEVTEDPVQRFVCEIQENTPIHSSFV